VKDTIVKSRRKHIAKAFVLNLLSPRARFFTTTTHITFVSKTRILLAEDLKMLFNFDEDGSNLNQHALRGDSFAQFRFRRSAIFLVHI